MTASAPFAWSAGQAPEGTDTAWVLDPDQVLTETPCPEWTPWPDCAPSSTARDLAFEIHATTPGREACEAWYEWYAENG
ncbi:MAG: hypothetical protein JXX28_17045 [Deltaproteobacteria bacterium]|nr:hypothetical protein [Deltaproteobacteria bacterium]